MDILFKQIFFNQPFIRNLIFYQVSHDVNCNTVRYKYYNNVGMMIKNGDLKLLEFKLNRQEYLWFDRNSVQKTTMSIGDDNLDLFIKIHSRFKSLYPMDWSMAHYGAAKKGHWKIVQYLMAENHSEWDETLLQSVLASGDVEMVLEATKYVKSVSSTSFIFALESDNRIIISHMFKVFKKSFDNFYISLKEHVLIAAARTDDVMILKEVQQYFESSFYFFGFRNLYRTSLIWNLYHQSIGNYEMYKYIKNTFDLSVTLVEQPENPNKVNPFIQVGVHGNKEIFKEMMDGGMFNVNYIIQMLYSALKENRIEFYEYVLKEYKDIEGVSSFSGRGFQLGAINKIQSIDQARYVLENLTGSPPIGIHDLTKALFSSFEIFKYVYQVFRSRGQQLSIEMIDLLIIEIFKMDDPVQGIMYLYTEGIDFTGTKLFTYLINLDPNKSLPILQAVFKLHKPNYENFDELVIILSHYARFTRCLKTFKLIYYHVSQLPLMDSTQLSLALSKCFIKAAQGAHYQTILFMLEQNHQPMPNDYRIVLENAAEAGSILILKHIIEQDKKKVTSSVNIMEHAINSGRFDCVQYLLPLCLTHIYQLSEHSRVELGKSNNLLLTKYLFSQCPFLSCDFFEPVLKGTKQWGSTELNIYLKEKGVEERPIVNRRKTKAY